jgi:hypothetical protein
VGWGATVRMRLRRSGGVGGADPRVRRGEGGRARGGRGRVRTDDDDNISFLLAVGLV